LNSLRETICSRKQRNSAPGFAAIATAVGTSCVGTTPNSGSFFPEKIDPGLTVPAWPQFLRGCLRYRESLDAQLPDAPRMADEFKSPDGSRTLEREPQPSSISFNQCTDGNQNDHSKI
jgi:hypothetical protein